MVSLKKEFTCYWEYPKYFSAIKMKNMKILFKNLGIEVVRIDKVVKKRRVGVTFTLRGTEEQYHELNQYMQKIRHVS